MVLKIKSGEKGKKGLIVLVEDAYLFFSFFGLSGRVESFFYFDEKVSHFKDNNYLKWFEDLKAAPYNPSNSGIREVGIRVTGWYATQIKNSELDPNYLFMTLDKHLFTRKQ